MIKPAQSHLAFNTVFPKLVLLLIGLQFSQLADAQNNTGSERWYQVELIAFKRQLQNQQEQWPTSIKLTYPHNWVELKNPDELENPDELKSPESLVAEPASGFAITTPDNAATVPQPSAFILLPASDRNLARHAASLRRDSRFEVIFHETWRQPVGAAKNAPAVLIRGGADYGQHAELEGSITVSLAQLLQVKTRLWLTRFAPNHEQFSGDWPALPVAPNYLQAQAEAAQFEGAEQLLSDSPEQPAQSAAAPTAETDLLASLGDAFVPVRIVTLEEERKMRNKELHYFDHPLFGLIMQITPYDPSVPAP